MLGGRADGSERARDGRVNATVQKLLNVTGDPDGIALMDEGNTYLCMHVSACTFKRTRTCVCVYKYVYIFYIYECVYIYMYTNKLEF